MMRTFFISTLLAAVFGGMCLAEVVVPTRTIKAQTILTRDDVMIKSATIAGAYSNIDAIVGLESRVALFQGRPIRRGDVGPPAIIERNQMVILEFDRDGLQISTEGRSLMRGTVGDRIRVMNLSSRSTVSGQVQPDGRILVSQ